MSFLDGQLDSIDVNNELRISTFINSSYRHQELLTGAQDFEISAVDTPASSGVYIDSLPQPGNCALGGCGDALSQYASSCTDCGCTTPGCGDTPDVPLQTISPLRAFSNTDCRNADAPCRSWLDFHNCSPAARHEARAHLCPNLK